LKPQALNQYWCKTSFKIDSQCSCGRYIKNGFHTVRPYYPLDARGKDRFGLPRTGSRLQNEVATRKDRRNSLFLKWMEVFKPSQKGAVGIGKQQKRGSRFVLWEGEVCHLIFAGTSLTNNTPACE
jgi:hypothetical protein